MAIIILNVQIENIITSNIKSNRRMPDNDDSKFNSAEGKSNIEMNDLKILYDMMTHEGVTYEKLKLSYIDIFK